MGAAMNLKHLEVFEAIMRSGTVSAAARELGMTQSAVSRILARLEEDLGYPLFRRANGRLEPTVRASAVLVQVREVLFAMSGLRELRNEDRAGSEDRLTFVTVPSLAHALIPSVLRTYSESRPNSRFAFDVRTTEAAVDEVVRRQAEFAVVALPVSHPTLTVTPLFRATSCCVMRADHPLVGRETISAADLRGEGLIFLHRRQPTRQLIEEAFLRAGVMPTIRVETSNVATACRCAGEGLGIAVVNALMAGYSADEDLVIRPFEPRIHHTLALVEPLGRPRPVGVSAFLSCLEQDVEAMARRRAVTLDRLTETHSVSEWGKSET